MARIKMKHQQKLSVEEVFKLFIASSSAKGLTEKTLDTYQHHFKAVFNRVDTSINIADLIFIKAEWERRKQFHLL